MGEEIKTESVTPSLDDVKKAIAELKAENDRRAKLIEDEKKEKANMLLSGLSPSGSVAPQPKPEMSNREYAKAVLSGKIPK